MSKCRRVRIHFPMEKQNFDYMVGVGYLQLRLQIQCVFKCIGYLIRSIKIDGQWSYKVVLVFLVAVT